MTPHDVPVHIIDATHYGKEPVFVTFLHLEYEEPRPNLMILFLFILYYLLE